MTEQKIIEAIKKTCRKVRQEVKEDIIWYQAENDFGLAAYPGTNNSWDKVEQDLARYGEAEVDIFNASDSFDWDDFREPIWDNLPEEVKNWFPGDYTEFEEFFNWNEAFQNNECDVNLFFEEVARECNDRLIKLLQEEYPDCDVYIHQGKKCIVVTLKQVKSYEEIREKVEETFQELRQELSNTEAPTLEQAEKAASSVFSLEDWGDQGDLALVERGRNRNGGGAYAIWAGIFWDPNKEHERFVGVWVNSNSQDPAESWDYWVGWEFKKALPDEVGEFVEA